MEEERFEEITRTTLKFLDAMCLHNSMEGRRWPCPKKGTTRTSADIFARSKTTWFAEGVFLLYIYVRRRRRREKWEDGEDDEELSGEEKERKVTEG